MARRAKNRASQSLDKYLEEIDQTPLLKPKEEIKLAQRIKGGDQEALEKLTKANLRFVISIAKTYQNRGLSLGDLISEGNLGLVKAAKRFDETRGFKFISYAVWWIRQAILQALAEQSRVVRLPTNRVADLNKITKIYFALEQENQREPTTNEIAEQLGMSAFDVARIMKLSGKHCSMDAPFSNSEGMKLLDVIPDGQQLPPDSNLMEESLKFEIAKALVSIDKREADVLKLYFGLGQEAPLTLEEIGARFNLTRERVRQIKEKALRRLRHISRSQRLRLAWTND